jgi:hypothetical protein
VPDERIGIVVDCRPVADRIVAGLGEHRSQHHVMSDDPSDTERWNGSSAGELGRRLARATCRRTDAHRPVRGLG